METPQARILVVEDDPIMAEMCERVLRRTGFETDVCHDGHHALEMMARQRYDLVLTDVRMPGMDGLQLLQAIRQGYPDTVVVLITAYADTASAVDAMAAGAFDYISKPFTREQLRDVVRRALESRERQPFPAPSEEEVYERVVAFSEIIGQSEAMRSVVQQAMKAAVSDASVLILGESGTGKELLARAIHRASERSSGPFVVVDCACIPEHLLESELFGYEAGAFTGAHRSKLGLIEMAHRGTLFLDEVAELPLPLQAKLFRVLQERTIRHLGGNREIPVNFRLVSATSQNLDQMVREGRFREELWYRLNVITLKIPPLRERKEDILLLAHCFLNRLNASGKRRVEGFASATLLVLQAYDWPGNVRELQNAVEHAYTMCEGPWITPLDLPPAILERVQPPTPQTIEWPQELLKKPFYQARREVLTQFERAYFRQLMQRTQGRVQTAAHTAGLHRSVLYRFLKKHRLEAPKREGELDDH